MARKKEKDETILVNVANSDQAATQAEVMGQPEFVSVSADLINDENPVSFETKAQQDGTKFSGTLSYEDVLSQTNEFGNLKDIEYDYIKRDSKLRQEKIEALDEHFKDLNAQPLSSVDSYDNYNLVLNKSIWNFNEIEQRNTKFSLLDLSLQTQIYLFDGVIISIEEVEATINKFVEIVLKNIITGYPVILNPSLIMDSLRFDKSKVIPIAIANPKLVPPIGTVEWQSIVSDTGNNRLIIETFIKLLDNALTNGHECEFFPDTILVRNASGINSLFISESAAVVINHLVKPTSPKNK